MANTQSARKNIRKSKKRHSKRKGVMTKIKRQLKDTAGHPEKNSASLLQKALDKAAAAGVIKKNKARRLKSRAMRRLKVIG